MLTMSRSWVCTGAGTTVSRRDRMAGGSSAGISGSGSIGWGKTGLPARISSRTETTIDLMSFEWEDS